MSAMKLKLHDLIYYHAVLKSNYLLQQHTQIQQTLSNLIFQFHFMALTTLVQVPYVMALQRISQIQKPLWLSCLFITQCYFLVEAPFASCKLKAAWAGSFHVSSLNDLY